MTEINTSREISASLERVWNIVYDVDSEPRCRRDLHSVYNISMNGNVIEWEITVGDRNSAGRQTAELHVPPAFDRKLSVE